jgi:hypothetical protein
MSNFPRWRGRKHFDAVATVEFSDGAAFEDIEKVIILNQRRVIVDLSFLEPCIFVRSAHDEKRFVHPLFTSACMRSSHDWHVVHDKQAARQTEELHSEVWRSM